MLSFGLFSSEIIESCLNNRSTSIWRAKGNKKSFVVFLEEEERTMTETQVFKFRLPKPEANVGMAFLGHQDSKAPIINGNKVGVFGKDSGVPNRKRLIIKFRIPNPNTLKNNHQDSKPINKKLWLS